MKPGVLTPFDAEHGDTPMEKTLCVFRFKDETIKDGFMLGSFMFSEKEKRFIVKCFGDKSFIECDKFSQYQYVLNEDGGFLFIRNG